MFAVWTKLGIAEKAIVRVVPFDGNTNIHGLGFQKQLTMESVGGNSGHLMVEKNESTAMD